MGEAHIITVHVFTYMKSYYRTITVK